MKCWLLSKKAAHRTGEAAVEATGPAAGDLVLHSRGGGTILTGLGQSSIAQSSVAQQGRWRQAGASKFVTPGQR